MPKFTRRELYDLIWAKPMRDVARELDISDVGLRKICLSHRIPIPPQDHWNRLRAGHKLCKRPLRKVELLQLRLKSGLSGLSGMIPRHVAVAACVCARRSPRDMVRKCSK